MSEVNKAVEAVVSIIRQLANEGDLPKSLATAPIDGGTRLEELALDSLGKMNLLTAIDEKLRIYVPDDSISPEMTLRALAERVAKRMAR